MEEMGRAGSAMMTATDGDTVIKERVIRKLLTKINGRTISEEASVSSSETLEEEPTIVDPFSHSLKMSKLRWARTYLLATLIIPIKVLIVSLMVLISYVISRIALCGISKDQRNKPFRSNWRHSCQRLIAFLGRACFRIMGFMFVKVKGRRANADEAPILVVAPHSTFFDGFVVFWCDLPYIVSRGENRKIPLLGKCMELVQTIFVNREDPTSRWKTIQEIKRRCNMYDNPDKVERWPQLIIFPEGSTSNRKALIKFKPGAFYPGKPVQPVLIRYPNTVDTVTWTWNQPHGAFKVLWTTLAQLFLKAEIEFLDVYHPNDEEKKDAKLFAANVRSVMASALAVPKCDVAFEEVKEKYKCIKRKDKPD